MSVVTRPRRRRRDVRRRRARSNATLSARLGSVLGYLRALGPGLVTGASDDDPSGIATYAQAGSNFGFGLLWTALITFPLMAGVQEICDRTALATGKGLGQLATERFVGRSEFAVRRRRLCLAAEMERHARVTSRLRCRGFGA